MGYEQAPGASTSETVWMSKPSSWPLCSPLPTGASSGDLLAHLWVAGKWGWMGEGSGKIQQQGLVSLHHPQGRPAGSSAPRKTNSCRVRHSA